MKSSYQKLKDQVNQLKEQLAEAQKFEMHLKNYIRADIQGNEGSKQNVINYFKAHSPHYASEIGLISPEEQTKYLAKLKERRTK